MKAFQKLALAAAIASVPMVGVAMEPLNDDGLAGVTGQDGISIGIDLDALNLNVYVEDTDGLGDGTRDGAGVIGITGLVLDTDNNDITIEIDAGSTAGAGANTGVLRMDIKAPKLAINEGGTFSIGVAGSDSTAGLRDAETGWENIDTAKSNGFTEIISLGNLVLTDLELGIELGPEADNFLAINTTAILDISLDEFTLTDADGGGKLFTDNILIENVELDGTTASITTDGLVLTMGAATTDGMRIAMMGQGFGVDEATSGVLGNVYVDGLDLGGTVVTVKGH